MRKIHNLKMDSIEDGTSYQIAKTSGSHSKKAVNNKMIIIACETGKLEKLKDLWKFPYPDDEILTRGYITASYYGNLNIIQYLETLDQFQLDNETIQYAHHWSTVRGHLGVTKHLTPKLNNRDILRKSFIWAIAQGNPDIVRYMLPLPEISSNKDYLLGAVYGAAKLGYHNTLRPLIEETSVGQDNQVRTIALEKAQQSLQSSQEMYISLGIDLEKVFNNFHLLSMRKTIKYLTSVTAS